MDSKKTKIICTIGPASWDPKVLEELAREGMDITRLNMSHGSYEEKAKQIDNIRKISRKLGKTIAIVADLQGPKLRLGEIEGIKEINKGERISLSICPLDNELSMQFDLSPFVKKGQRIFLNDGLVELKVLEVKGKTIKTEALNYGTVSSHKGVNVPNTFLKGAAFTDKDFKDAEFALDAGVDYLALSFVQTPDDLKRARELIKNHHSTTKIIVKIEKTEAILYLEDIVKASDAVMVARGDLGIEVKAAEVPILQEKIIKLCRQHQKPVIVATQMLESMVENPRPTRAETSDVANAVLDQVDAVMLSAETASGKYPIEAVRVMNDVITSIEKHPEYQSYIKIRWEDMPLDLLPINALVSAAASIAYRTKAKVIAAATTSGHTVRLLASFRPSAKIIALAHDEETKNQLQLVWGTQTQLVESASDSDHFWEKIIQSLKKNKLVSKGDRVVMVSGSIPGITGTTDTIRVITI